MVRDDVSGSRHLSVTSGRVVKNQASLNQQICEWSLVEGKSRTVLNSAHREVTYVIEHVREPELN